MNPVVTKARWAVAMIFAVHGGASGTFAARIPWIADHLHLSPGQLGLCLLMPAVGSLSTMPFAGRVVHRIGGKRAIQILITAWALAIIMLPYAPNRWVLMAMLLVAGSAAGTSDIAMNAEGVVVEERLGKSIMSSLHGMWSVGTLLGGAIGVAAAYRGIGAPIHLTVVGLVLAVVGLVSARWLFDGVPQNQDSDEVPRFSLPRGAVLIIGLVGFCAVFAEVASADWCALYLRRVLGAGEGQAAVAYTMFAFAMAGGRLAGDMVVRKWGVVRTVRGAGALGVVGGILVVTAWSPEVVTAGFAFIGLGISVVVPLAFSAGGKVGNNPAHGIAGVATIAYGSGLAAPAIMGAVAELTSLTASFALVTALVLIVTLSARRLEPAQIQQTPVEAAR